MAELEYESLLQLYEHNVSCPKPYGILYKDSKYFLVMESILESKTATDRDQQLKLSLLKLYQVGKYWGYTKDNFIGSLPQPNSIYNTFSEYWIESRIKPMLNIIRENGININQNQLLSVIENAIERWNLNTSKPYLIHGDLWSGNIIYSNSKAFLIDPSLSYGHPEQDLAMLELFGSSLSANSQFEILHHLKLNADTFKDRIPFWQIYPLLVHVAIFGRNYLPSLTKAWKGII
ncbi:MAG: fructosamine kinase family protein [Leptospiraceae bacterium]|nr:fructosamine kinase family protein [Leptospiraceae bacterium]